MSDCKENAQLETQESNEAVEAGEHGDVPSEALHGSDSAQSSPHKTDKQKIDILLKATGNAPIMKKKKWAVDQERQIGWIIEFIKKYLKLDPSDSLFLYVNQAFAPSPDQIVKNLYECYGTDGKLVLHYCKSQAWG